MSRVAILWRWFIALLVLMLGVIFSFQLSVNDNAMDLLPDGAVKGDLQILQELGLVDRVIITLSADDTENPSSSATKTSLQQSAVDLGAFLKKSSYFSHVTARLPAGYGGQMINTFWQALPILLDDQDLLELEERISGSGLKQIMQENFALLNSPAGMGVKEHIQRDPLGITRLLLAKMVHLRSEFDMNLEDGFFTSRDGRSVLIFAESTLSLTDSANAERIQAELEDAYNESLVPGIHARVIGSLPHTLANSRSIQRDLRILLPAATLLLILLLSTTLRKIRALAVLSVPFMAAPPAIAITSYLFGEMSALALGFGIVLLGIAVDFSIHIYLTLSSEQGTHQDLLQKIRRPILYATLTTTGVLVVLLFSEVASHRQMATLALSGVTIAVIFAWLLIPTIVPENTQVTPSLIPGFKRREPTPPWLQKWIQALWLVLVIAGLLALPRLQYNGDLRVLDAPDQQVIADEDHFNRTWGNTGDKAFVVSAGDNLAEALDTNYRVYRFLQKNEYTSYQSIAPILPGPVVQQENGRLWAEFWEADRFDRFSAEFAASAKHYGFTDNAFEGFLGWLKKEPGTLSPGLFLESPMQPVLKSMIRNIDPARVGNDGQHLILTTVPVDDGGLVKLLSQAEKEADVYVLANGKWRREVERYLKRDIITLSFAAGCIIVLLVAIQFRRLAAVAAVLAPVISALSAMSVFCWITDGELNMMHLIMGIMVIGLSVDYGIFIVCSQEQRPSSTTAKAVSICAASSLIGFGVLTFASHPALHSLGITVLVGIGTAWPVALIVSPSLLGPGFPREGV